jgi:Holliday junction resolvasome RuvABC endonuclease subunit
VSDLKITGLDLSLTGTGVAVYQPGGVAVHLLSQGANPKKIGGSQYRLLYLRRQVCELARGSTHIVVEGAAYARPEGQHKLGGLWWLVMHCLWMENPDAQVVVVDPGTVKQYVTGRRGAPKDQVMLAVQKRYPMVEIIDNNTADATVLVAMCLDMLGCPPAPVPEAYRAPALASWPYKPIEEL